MPYGDLEAMRVQRFATLADIDASHPTIEEREEYEPPVEMGMIVYAGVDYGEILALAEAEADVIIWDGGNNDFPFFSPDLSIVVVDPLRAGHELAYHPGEANLRMADVVVVNKIDSAELASIEEVLEGHPARQPAAHIVLARSPVDARGRAVDRGRAGARRRGRPDAHPRRHGLRRRHRRSRARREPPSSSTRGRTRSARSPRPSRGTRTSTSCRRWATPTSSWPSSSRPIDACDCDVVVTGTPIDLARLIRSRHPIRHATYRLEEAGGIPLADLLEPIVAAAGGARPVAAV